MKDYHDFLQSKLLAPSLAGLPEDAYREILPSALFPWQSVPVSFALRRARAALFEDCGLGKTVQLLSWCKVLLDLGEIRRALIISPLQVVGQTIDEGRRLLDLEVEDCRDGHAAKAGIGITNYESSHKIDPSEWDAVVLDESSILKAYSGTMRTRLIEEWGGKRWKLACTATPAPNDVVELQNHALFLEVPGANEMIARWFVTDSTQAGNYRLKRHAREDFWAWVCGWAVSLESPADIGFSADGYDLPDLEWIEHPVKVDLTVGTDDKLFRTGGTSATEIHRELRLTAEDRAVHVASIVAADPEEPWIIWVDTNHEADAITTELAKVLDPEEFRELRGSDSPEKKLDTLDHFKRGGHRVLVTKSRLCGFGLNWQHCARMAFSGLSYSYEAMYQSIRRCWRFGQERPVQVHLVYAETEAPVRASLARKMADHESMKSAMYAAVRRSLQSSADRPVIAPTHFAGGDRWDLWHGDSVELIKSLAPESVGLTVTSPPFSSLYTYSDALADMGNSASDEEFLHHFRYLAGELERVTIPGRLCVLHCKDLPRYMGSHGRAGISDFPAQLREAMELADWQFHSRITIWKCPKEEMEKTKSHGLLHVQLCKDSAASRQGLPDYLMVFRKWGPPGTEFTDPVNNNGEPRYRFNPGDYAGTEPPLPTEYRDAREPNRQYSILVWRKYASPVWFDIRMTDVLQHREGRDPADERHICPLQLQVIARAIHLWSNPGDLVLDPFVGIGSTAYAAIDLGRRALGYDLKESYLRQAVANVESLLALERQGTLF